MSAWWRKLLGRWTSRPEVPAEVRAAGAKAEDHGTARSRSGEGPTRRLTIGLDFGTSTTKCCLHEDHEEAPFHFLAFRDERDGGSLVLMPTAVTVREDALYFGATAEHMANSETVRSFKMCLLCQAQAASRRAHTSDCPNCRPDRRGWFQLGSGDLSAEDLSTLYVAYVLGLAKQAAPFLEPIPKPP